MKVFGWILLCLISLALVLFAILGVASIVNEITISAQFYQWFPSLEPVADAGAETVARLVLR